MTQEITQSEEVPEPAKSKWKGGKVRPLTTDERASFVILAAYMFTFCICTFLYWDILWLKIAGITLGSGGMFLFVAAFFNTEAPEESNSIHPVRSYFLSLIVVLLVLLMLRFVGGLVGHFVTASIILYGGILIALVVFRKAMVQVITTMLVVIFLFVTLSNRQDIWAGHMKFKDAVRQCGLIVFEMVPIQDMANMLITGNYIGYLSRIDYRDEQLNILAVRTVAGANDDEVEKTKAILSFVSNEIHYVSDPADNIEYAKGPILTLISGGGDCEDQTLLLCSMLETVGVTTFIAFTDEHVFSLVQFDGIQQQLGMDPFFLIDGRPVYALDPSIPEATIGLCLATPEQVKRIFHVRRKVPVAFKMVR
jgi:hypothetical protein